MLTLKDISEELLNKKCLELKDRLPLLYEQTIKNLITIALNDWKDATTKENLRKELNKSEINLKKISYLEFSVGQLHYVWIKYKEHLKIENKLTEIPKVYANIDLSEFNKDYKLDLLHRGIDVSDEDVEIYCAKLKALVKQVCSSNQNPPIVSKSNLPQLEFEFVGREKEIKELFKFLSKQNRYPFIVISSGIGGIGKSALALEVAHRCLIKEFGDLKELSGQLHFDGYVWVSAKRTTWKGEIPESSIINTRQDILSEIIRIMEPSQYKNRPLIEKQEKIVNDILRNKRVLLIVDNMETIEDKTVLQFLQLLPGNSKAIVTSKNKLDWAGHLNLPEFSMNESKQFIKQIQTKVLKENEIEKIASNSHGIPLIILIFLGFINNRDYSVDYFNDFFKGKEGKEILSYLFEYVWKKCSVEAKRILEILSILGADENDEKKYLKKSFLSNCLNFASNKLEETVGELINLSCVKRVFDDTGVQESKYCTKLPLIEFVLNNQNLNSVDILHRRQDLCNNIKELIPTENELPDYPSIKRINVIMENLELILWSTDDAYQREDYEFVCVMVRLICYALGVRGHNDYRMRMGRLAYDSAKKIGNLEEQARNLVMNIAWVYFIEEEFDKAEKKINESIEFLDSLNNKAIIGTAYRLLGQIRKETIQKKNKSEIKSEDYEEANSLIEKALQYLEESDDKRMLATTYGTLGSLYRDMGNLKENINQEEESKELYQKSYQMLEKAISIVEQLQDTEELQSVYFQKITNTSVKLNQLDQARVYNEKARKLSKRLERQVGLAYCLRNDALIYEKEYDSSQNQEKIVRADELAEEAQKLFLQTGSKEDIKNDVERIKEKRLKAKNL